jgi:hypothetical protein
MLPAGRYDNTIPARFLAHIDCSKIPVHMQCPLTMRLPIHIKMYTLLKKGKISKGSGTTSNHTMNKERGPYTANEKTFLNI